MKRLSPFEIKRQQHLTLLDLLRAKVERPGFAVVYSFQQAFGAFAQVGQIEQAVMTRSMDGRHANSFGARSADKPGAGMKMR